MPSLDVDVLADIVTAAIKAAQEPLLARLAMLEAREALKGDPGPAGPAGPQGDPGAAGRDGVDGLGFQDIDVQHDGERAFTFKFVRGERVKEIGAFAVPVVLDRGVFKEGATYDRGDGVTFGGSFFIAQKHTAAKPEDAGGDWRLAVKRGREGREGKPGPPGPQGVRGEKGERGLQKW
jgi:integrin beta 3